MPFKKGESGNPKGKIPMRKRGNDAQELSEKITRYMNLSFAAMQKDLKKLKPVDRAKLYSGMLQFVLSKPKPEEEKKEETTDNKQLTIDNG